MREFLVRTQYFLRRTATRKSGMRHPTQFLRDPQGCTDLHRCGTYRGWMRVCRMSEHLLFWEKLHAVCNGVARQETGNALISAPIQRRSIPRASGKRRPVYSDNGLPRYPVVSCKWLFSADER